jgi:hypothetical protein
MGFKKEDLKKAEHPLYGFGNKKIEALGKIDVNVSFGQKGCQQFNHLRTES